ncbi:MAG: hypothetical protein JNK32_02810 [Anaerolineales bacterium]|nr:hypothetical protein [Anaerolineales bacterium]
MKTVRNFGMIAFLMVILLMLLAMSNFNLTAGAAQHATAAFLAHQTTSTTPVLDDDSEIGSTDGILVMGVVITLIVILPILLHKKNK